MKYRNAKKICVIVICIIIGNYSIAQSQKSFDKLINKTNRYLDVYSGLTPFGEDYVNISNFKMSRADIKEMKIEAHGDDNIFKNSITVEKFFFMYFIQEKIESNIHALLAHSQFVNNSIDSLLNEEISIIKSDDNKLYNFSLDEKTGGTYRSRISWMYYSDLNIDSINILNQDSDYKIDPYEAFQSDGFSEIFTLNTEEGVKYLLTAYVRGCSYCFGNSIRLIQFKNGEFSTDFLYSTYSRSWDSGITYDSENRVINVEYQTDDLTSYCNCSEEPEDDYEKESLDLDDDFVFRNCSCEFKFNGKTFVLSKECMEVVERLEE